MKTSTSKKPAQKTHKEHRAEVVERMSQAVAIAETVFGAKTNLYAEQEICGYLKDADEEGVAEFSIDLKEAYEDAQTVHKTDSPTPEQVFGIYDLVWNDGDEDEE